MRLSFAFTDSPSSRSAVVRGSRWIGSATAPSLPERWRAQRPADSQQSQRLVEVGTRISGKIVNDDSVVCRVGQAWSTSPGTPVINRARPGSMLAALNAALAADWWLPSASIVVRTPSSAIPPKIARPLTPVPVPTSTTARAPVAATSALTIAAAVRDGAAAPSSELRWRAAAC